MLKYKKYTLLFVYTALISWPSFATSPFEVMNFTKDSHKYSGKGCKILVLEGGFNLEHTQLKDKYLKGYDSIDRTAIPDDQGQYVNNSNGGWTEKLIEDYYKCLEEVTNSDAKIVNISQDLAYLFDPFYKKTMSFLSTWIAELPKSCFEITHTL